MSALGGIISGLFSMGGQLMSNASNARQNRKNRNFQEQENERNRIFATDMWNKDNEYNTPKNQMSRLRDAGVNPHLAYESGSGLNASNVATATTPSGIAPIPAGKSAQWDTSKIGEVAMQLASIKNIEAQTKKVEAETKNTEMVAGMNALDLENKANVIVQENDLRSVNIAGGRANVSLTQEKVQETTQSIINMTTQNEQVKEQINNLISKRMLTDQEKVNAVAQLSVIYATYKEINSRSNLNNANANLANERSKTEGVTRSNIQADTQNKGELFKSMTRSNYVGDKYDLSNAESKSKFNEAEAKRAFELVKQSQLGNQMLNKKLTEQDYINAIRMFEAVGAPANTFQQYKNAINPLNGRTTTTFDNQGNYRGHSTTRNHR